MPVEQAASTIPLGPDRSVEMRTLTVWKGVVPAVIAASLVTGCGSSDEQTSDKAGGSNAPAVLRLAASDGEAIAESRMVRGFAREVDRLSDGGMRVEITYEAAGDRVPDVEPRTALLVRDGRFDLGWVATRAWDELGVTSFQALQAPFLITNYAALDRVLTSPITGEMLAGLRAQRLVGLGLYPGLLRHPMGVNRRLTSMSDFAGARIRDLPSRASDALLRALGAVPVHTPGGNLFEAAGGRRIDGAEFAIPSALVGGLVSGNVIFFPKVLTLVANPDALARLSDEQRRMLREAVRRTVARETTHSLEHELGFEASLIRQLCGIRGMPTRVVLATDRDLATLVQAARPVYTQLERDPLTASLIARIRAIVASLPAPPPMRVPETCSRVVPKARPKGSPAAASALNGTYRRVNTLAMARAFGPPATNPGNSYPTVFTTVLRDGTWYSREEPGDHGSYRVAGNRIVFATNYGYDLTCSFVRDGDSTLHLTPVLPMERGDEFVWCHAPWRRVGPPTR
jgi:TRAP-type C4-dicarboxylate transport system substrate-binding protein